MAYICVAHWDAVTKQITGENSRETEAEAQALVAAMVSEGDVNAFFAAEPDTDKRYWIVDEATNTVIHSTAHEDAATAQAARDAIFIEIKRIESTIPDRWVRDAALGDAYAISELEKTEVLLNIERAKL